MSTPVWLAHYTTTSGNPDPRLAGRTARPRTCPGCGRLVLHGADHHRLAAYVSVDPFALTVAEEGKAVLAGIPTYELHGQPPRWELRARTFPGVRKVGIKEPASKVRVVAAHSCDRAPLSTATLPTRAPESHWPDDDTNIPY